MQDLTGCWRLITTMKENPMTQDMETAIYWDSRALRKTEGIESSRDMWGLGVIGECSKRFTLIITPMLMQQKGDDVEKHPGQSKLRPLLACNKGGSKNGRPQGRP